MTKRFNILNVFALVLLLTSYSAYAQVGVTKDNLNQNADQSQGNYDSTNLNYLGGVGSLGMMQSAWKDPMQHMGEGQTRPGYTKYYWSPDLVLPVRVREGMYTLINFPSWEIIENVYIGDGQSFNAQIEGPSSLMVYPDSSQFVGVDTNMIVFGRSGNKYVFYVQSETVNTDRITNAIIDIEVVKDGKNIGKFGSSKGSNGGFGAGSENGSEASTYTRSAQKEDWINTIPIDPTKFRFDIEVYVPNPDDIIIAPERVWRDNIFTYIDLGEKALTSVQRPIVTLIVERSETPIGFRAAGPNNRLIIVEGMGDMVLRSGKRIVCLKLRRADTDGLENGVYAPSNEWDVQNNMLGKDGIQNKENMDGKNNSENGNFFDNSSFFETEKGKTQLQTDMKNVYGGDYQGGKNTQQHQENNYVNGKYENGIKGANQGDNQYTNINSIPKVNPMVQEKNKENNLLSDGYDDKFNKDLEKEINEIKQEKVDMDNLLNTEKSEIKTSDKTAAKDNKKLGDKANKKIGNSNNNSSPVLITQQNSDGKDKVFVTPETEALLKEFRSGRAFANNEESNISIELGTDENVNNLEKLWSDISKHYSANIGKYQPFYSVDTSADGQGKELFHLRVGPIKSLEEGDNICSQLGRNGIFCSVVRIQ